VNFPIADRADLVSEVFERLHHLGIVRINGTPASGKSTLMNLMIRHLLKGKERDKSIYTLMGWPPNDVRLVGGWAKYLENETGVNGLEWIDYSGYLFLDEAQQSYWDERLWAGLFKYITPNSPCRIVLFTSYGSLEAIRVRDQET